MAWWSSVFTIMEGDSSSSMITSELRPEIERSAAAKWCLGWKKVYHIGTYGVRSGIEFSIVGWYTQQCTSTRDSSSEYTN